MEKVTNFRHFEQKNTHISGCKIVHKFIIAIVTVHICTVIVACAFIILIISSLSFSPCLWVLVTLTSLSLSSFDQIIPVLPPIIKPPRPINHQTRPIVDHQTTQIIHCHRSSNHVDQIIKRRPLQSSNHADQIIKSSVGFELGG